MTHPLPDKAVEAGARALCLHAGDDPDRLTYAHEMNCTGRDREPMYRWRYWVGFAEACGRAMIEAARSDTPHPARPERPGE